MSLLDWFWSLLRYFGPVILYIAQYLFEHIWFFAAILFEFGFSCIVSDRTFMPFAMLFILEGIYVFEALFMLESISFFLHLLVRFYSVLRNFGKNGFDF